MLQKISTVMKARFLISAILTLCMVACNGSRQNQAACNGDNPAETDTAATADITGQWYIENIFFNDTTYCRPSELGLGSRPYISLGSDGSYSVITNCNNGAGSYTVSGAAISFHDAAWTEMACDNMATEEAMREILPLLNAVDMENDSVMRINSGSEPYLILTRN